MEKRHESQSDRTVLYAPGLRQSITKVTPFIEALLERDVKVITHEPSVVLFPRSLDDSFQDKIEEWPFIQLAKANALYRTLLRSEAEHADVVGYCEGGVTGTILASIHPEIVNQLVLVNPAGMTIEDGPGRLVGRFKQKNRRYAGAILKDIVTGNIEQSTYRMMRANVNRILGMKALSSLAEVYMPETLKNLVDDGMKVSIVHGYRDGLYPYESVCLSVPEGVVHASFADPSAGHAVFDTHTHDTIDSVINLLGVKPQP